MSQDKSGRVLRLSKLDLVSLNNILADIQQRLSKLEAVGQSPDYKGKRLVNVGDATQDGDAVNLKTLTARLAALGG